MSPPKVALKLALSVSLPERDMIEITQNAPRSQASQTKDIKDKRVATLLLKYKWPYKSGYIMLPK